MQKNRTIKLISLVSIILIIATMIISSVCFASEEGIMPISEEAGDPIQEISIPDNEQITTPDTSNWINSDAYLFEDNIIINKVVDGNVFAIGKTVTVTGEIGGDLFVIADKVIIDGGYIYSGIFASANEIEINGVVYDLYAMAKKVTIGEEGYIYRDVRATAETLNLNGKIGRDAYIAIKELDISENGAINGNLEYTSSSEATISEEAIGGEIKYTPETITKTQSIQRTILSYIGDAAKALIYALIVVLLATWLAPKFTEKLKKTTRTDIALSLGIGILACIVTGVASIILMLSVLGIPLVCSFIAILLLLLSISKAIVAMTISGIIMSKTKIEGKMKFVLITLLLVFVIWSIGQIPFSIGEIFKIVIGIIGVGLVLINIINRKNKEQINENK